jgi:hypothetical protein
MNAIARHSLDAGIGSQGWQQMVLGKNVRAAIPPTATTLTKLAKTTPDLRIIELAMMIPLE